MSPDDDHTARTEVTLALFAALAELRALESDLLDTLARITAPENMPMQSPAVYPNFKTREAWDADATTPAPH